MERLVSALLEKASDRVDHAEVYVEGTLEAPVAVQYENSRLKSIISRDSTGVALRVVKGGRIGLATTTKLNDLDSLVARAIENAEFGPKLDYDLPSATPELPQVKTFSPESANLNMEALVDQGARLIAPALAYEPTCQAFSTVGRDATQVHLANTSGLSVTYDGTSYHAISGAELTEGDNFLMVYLGERLREPAVDIESMGGEVARQLRLGRNNVPFDAGRYPVIFTPRALMDLLRPFLACLDGQAVARDVSPWRERLGEAVLDQRVTLIDDGLIDWGARTAPIDDEGVPQQRTPLVESGVVKNFYLDLRSAGHLGMRPTGNGRRQELGSSPSPGLTNLVMAPGDTPLDDLLGGMKEGLIIYELMGAWAGNPYSGEVSGNISYGLKVEKGQPVGRVKNCVFSLNAFEHFSTGLEAISSDRERFMTALLPGVMLRDVAISCPKD